MEAQWTYTQRIMGEGLLRDGMGRDVWLQHAAMLDAVIAADGDAAENLARDHITQAAAIVIDTLQQRLQAQPAVLPDTVNQQASGPRT